MKKLYGKTIDIDIYNYDVPVFYGDFDLMKKWASSRFKNYNDIGQKHSFGAFCYRDDPEKYVTPDFIYIGKTKNNYGHIAHEAGHTALFLLSNCNVEIDPDYPSGHEAFTYLLGYLVKEITKNNWNEYNFNKKKWIKKNVC